MQLLSDGSAIEKNFALVGPGDMEGGEVLLKDSADCYKLYASGRRFCQVCCMGSAGCNGAAHHTAPLIK